MLDLTEEYNKMIKDIEKAISNPEELQYVKEKVSQIFMLVLDKIEQIIENYEVRLEHIVAHQQRITEKVEKMENSLNMIEKDIYEDEPYEEGPYEEVSYEDEPYEEALRNGRADKWMPKPTADQKKQAIEIMRRKAAERGISDTAFQSALTDEAIARVVKEEILNIRPRRIAR